MNILIKGENGKVAVKESLSTEIIYLNLVIYPIKLATVIYTIFV